MNEPGAVVWNELTTRRTDDATAFYSQVFGWQAQDLPTDADAYTTWTVGGRVVGGMMGMDDSWRDMPSHWMTYVEVEDVDATAARAEELGREVPVPPTNIPPGRFAVLIGPTGEVFSVMRSTERDA